MKRDFETPQEEALEICLSTRKKILEEKIDPEWVLSILRSCFVVASNLSKTEDLIWINGELNGTWGGEKNVPSYRKLSLQYKISGMWQEGFTEEVITNELMLLIYQLAKNKEVSIVLEKNKSVILYPRDCQKVVSKVINRCLSFLTSCIVEIQYSGKIQSLFEELRKEVDSKLFSIDPKIAQELQSIYTNLSSKLPSDWRKVSLSCRMAVKYLVDNVFPPLEEDYKCKDGTILKVTEDKVFNRLLACLDKNNVQKLTTKEAVNYLHIFNKETQDGVHEELSKKQASLIAIHTYLVFSDILNSLK